MYNSKYKRIISSAIIILLIVAMLAGIVASFFA